MNLLLLKVTLIPAVIALVTLAVRKWGNKIGGLIGSMPWTAGPILLFFILEQGKAFGIQSIRGAMTGILALISFVFSYSAFSRKLTWLPTLLLAYGLYTVTALIINYLQPGLLVSYALVIGVILLALRFFSDPNGAITQRSALTVRHSYPNACSYFVCAGYHWVGQRFRPELEWHFNAISHHDVGSRCFCAYASGQ